MTRQDRNQGQRVDHGRGRDLTSELEKLIARQMLMNGREVDHDRDLVLRFELKQVIGRHGLVKGQGVDHGQGRDLLFKLRNIIGRHIRGLMNVLVDSSVFQVIGTLEVNCFNIII